MINPQIENVQSIVKKYLNVYDFRITPDHLEFYFTIMDERIFEENFEKLRLEFKNLGLIPLVKRKGGEYVLIVTKTQKRKYWSVHVNIILLLLTIASTIWVGMQYYEGYYGSHPLLQDIWGGFVYFSLPLLTILGIHEMGHYFAAKRHHVAASLPFFIPAPTILGTLGAFISLREPIPNRKSLVDIGLAGPIAGFIAAIPITLIGIYLGNLHPPNIIPETKNTLIIFHVPLIYIFLTYIISPIHSFVHPVAMAGWVGFVVTAINLFPIGQLDGGHVARALAGEKTKYISYGFAALLVALGFFYTGWLIFAFFVIFLGLRHPPPLNDIIKLDKKRIALAVSGFLILAVTFVPVPIEMTTHHIEVNATVDSSILLSDIRTSTVLSISIENKGKIQENITLEISGNFIISDTKYNFVIDPGERWENTTTIWMKEKGKHTLWINLTTDTGYRKSENITLLCLNKSTTLSFHPQEVHKHEFNVTLYNSGKETNIKIMSLKNVFWKITNSTIPIINNTLFLGENESAILHFVVGGATVLLAINLNDYEAAYLKVEV